MRKLLLVSLLASSAVASPLSSPIPTSMQSYADSGNPLDELVQTLEAEPTLAGRISKVCINDDCQEVFERKGGTAEKLEFPKNSWASDVATVVKSATGGVSGNATVKVGVTVTDTKPDGASSSTTVNVEVTVSGAKK